MGLKKIFLRIDDSAKSKSLSLSSNISDMEDIIDSFFLFVSLTASSEKEVPGKKNSMNRRKCLMRYGIYIALIYLQEKKIFVPLKCKGLNRIGL